MSIQSRRQLLTNAVLAGAASLGGFTAWHDVQAAEGPLETATVRFMRQPAICHAPQFVAEELLHAEGFTEVQFIDAATSAEINEAVAGGKVDFNMHFAPQWVSVVDAGGPINVIAGVHVGCFELFANDRIRTVADLKGKTVGVPALGSSDHLFVSVIAAHIGLDPTRDIRWVASPSQRPLELFGEGKIDALLGTPSVPQEMRARGIGHAVVNSSLDRPWSQYFCCMLGGNREFVRTKPVATKRVLRAILKAADLCASDPAQAARRLVDGHFTPRYDYALQTMRDVPYDKWREYNPEDTIRYYALRLHELGFVKASPQKIIADGTDWRFLDELKRELKA